MTNGYFNKLLRVNLTSGSVTEEEIPEKVLREFIGGGGLAAKYMLDEVPADCDPLGPENNLIFSLGPLTASGAIETGKHNVSCKSPLTGTFMEADCGGSWCIQMKRTGYDMYIIEGESAKPVYLWVTDENVELRDASHLWGLDTFETDEKVIAETNEKAVVTCVGTGAENGCLFSGVFNDGVEARTAGRGGCGTVMAAKKLKAIAVYGSKKPEIADKKALMGSVREVTKTMMEKAAGLSKFGTGGGVPGNLVSGDLPIKNWQLGEFDGADKISGQAMAEKYLIKQFKCANCVIGCGRHIQITEGPHASIREGGPEYETLGILGSNLLIDDLEAICTGNELCNRYGIDTISAGGTIAWAMECWEKGVISAKDTDGVELTWGNADAMIEMIKQIGEMRGFGKILGLGVVRAVEIIGQGSEEWAVHVKGLEPAAHDPRAYTSQALGYATGNRGGCHLQSTSHVCERDAVMPEIGIDEPLDRFIPQGKAHLVIGMQHCSTLCDSLKLCKFALSRGAGPDVLSLWVRSVTGWDMDTEELLKAGERIFVAKRLFNLKAGLTPKDDTLPPRQLTWKRGTGTAGESLPDLDYMLKEYYEMREWDPVTGWPSANKLKELGLEAYAK